MGQLRRTVYWAKEAVRKDMREANCPLILWDYCAKRRARIHNLTAKDLFQLEGQNPISMTLGEEGDISNLCNFGWYEWCYSCDGSNDFPYPEEVLGKVLGPAKNAGNEMCQWILKSNGQIVPRRMVRRLSPSEDNNPVEIEKRRVFDECIKNRLGNSISAPPQEVKPEFNTFIPYEDDDEAPRLIPEEDPVDFNGTPVMEQPYYDCLINAEVLLPQGEKMHEAKVVGRVKGNDGRVVGTYNENPFLNSVVYDVEFPDGAVKQYAANIIAENMLSQVDLEGYHHKMLESILDYGTDGHAVSKDEMYVVTK